jgi:hypothetical protein
MNLVGHIGYVVCITLQNIKMEKEFIGYSEALALKELGFDEPCMRGWYEDGGIWYHPDSDIILDNPTFSQAFRWLYQKLDIEKGVMPLDTESQQLLLKELIEIVKNQK